MAILNEKLLLYKVTGYIKHCVTHGKYCIPLGQSGSGSMIEDHSDHSASIGTAKSTLDLDSSVAMIRRDPSSGRSRGGGGGVVVVVLTLPAFPSTAILFYPK